MSGFSAASVAALSYDFSAFPQDGAVDPTLRCTGRGVIPEPSKAALRAFFEGFQEVVNPAAEGDPTDEELAAAADARDDKAYQILSDVCSGKPSVEELKQLPPRILAAFTRYLLENLAPKA